MKIGLLLLNSCLVILLTLSLIENIVQASTVIKGSPSNARKSVDNVNSTIYKLIDIFSRHKCRRFESAAKEGGFFPLLVSSPLNGKYIEYRTYGDVCDPDIEEKYWVKVQSIVLSAEVPDPVVTGFTNLTLSESNTAKAWGDFWLDRDDEYSPYACNFKKLLECDVISKRCYCRKTGLGDISLDRQYDINYRKGEDGSLYRIYEVGNGCAVKGHLESCDWNLPYIGQCSIPCYVNSTCMEYDPVAEEDLAPYDAAGKIGRRRCVDPSAAGRIKDSETNGGMKFLVGSRIIPVQVILIIMLAFFG